MATYPLKDSKVTFPSEVFAQRLANLGIYIDEPLFSKYILPNNMDEQTLQDIVKTNLYGNETVESVLSMSNLARQIKLLNPELNVINIIPGSVFDIQNFLHGVASRFTPRDINYFLSSRSAKENKITEATLNMQDSRIKAFTGHFPGFIMPPSVKNKIVKQIEIKETSTELISIIPIKKLTDSFGRVDDTGFLRYMEEMGAYRY
jgi:hypothetical protein